MNGEKSVVEDTHALETSKAYALDLLNAGYAFMGFHKGYEDEFDSIKDEAIQDTVSHALEEIEEAMAKEYHTAQEELHACNKNSTEEASLHLRTWKETNTGGISLVQMLKKENVLTGSVVLCKNNGIFPYYCSRILAYALFYESALDQSAKRVKEYLDYYGVKGTLKQFCGLDKEPELLQLIAEQVESIKAGKNVDARKVDVLKRAFSRGFEYEKVYRGCAQCTIMAMFDVFGRENGVLFQSASGLSAGMAQTGDGACGGYTGGIMYMGSVIGRRLDRMKIDKDRPAQLESYSMSRKLRDKFINTYGSVICADVHREIFGKSYCLRTQVIKDEFEDAGAHTIKCTTVIGTASTWVAEILYDSGYYDQPDQ